MKILSQEQLQRYLQARYDIWGQAKVAEELKISQPYVNALYHDSRPISKKVANKLGYTTIRNFTRSDKTA